jgi:Cu-Zn family superoxide dismutase
MSRKNRTVSSKTKPPAIRAIAYFDMNNITGRVYFTENLAEGTVDIDIMIQGLTPNTLHGFHVHECGDMSEKCESACAHFNPYGKKHGCPGAVQRHVGDLGNLVVDGKGMAKYTMSDNVIKLRGSRANIIGRSLIIHAGVDDCGLGGDEESLKTGNAGKRIACAIIGYAK